MDFVASFVEIIAMVEGSAELMLTSLRGHYPFESISLSFSKSSVYPSWFCSGVVGGYMGSRDK